MHNGDESLFSRSHALFMSVIVGFCSGLGQVQLHFGDFKSASSNFEKVLEAYPDNCETLKVS